MKVKTIVKIIIGIYVFICIAIIFGKTEQKTKNKTDGITTIATERESIFVNVTYKNNTNNNLNYITIKAICYDKNNNNLGTKTAYETNINTKDKYKTKIIIPIETETYKILYDYN